MNLFFYYCIADLTLLHTSKFCLLLFFAVLKSELKTLFVSILSNYKFEVAGINKIMLQYRLYFSCPAFVSAPAMVVLIIPYKQPNPDLTKPSLVESKKVFQFFFRCVC